ncbi:MAG: MFS transporter, partial [Enterobacterales bacterium]|nr:MFS transporter [Enterobacterales bacterium]
VSSEHAFVGSYLVLACLLICAIFVVSNLDSMQVQESQSQTASRPLSYFFSSPFFLVALSSGAVAYSVMTYLMTASPLSMHSDHAYDMQAIKWVVQSHVLAMYVPSLFSAWLVAKLGIRALMLIGTFLYVAVVAVSLTGHSVMHYWWAMVLLGVGWNFLYLCGTLLLTEVYRPEERFKVQAVNDFGIFGIQALASLSAGVILFSQGWSVLVSITIPVIILMLLITIWYISVVYKKQMTNVGEIHG